MIRLHKNVILSIEKIAFFEKLMAFEMLFDKILTKIDRYYFSNYLFY